MLTIIIGTETGTAEFVGDEIVGFFTSKQMNINTILEPKLDELLNSKLWIICTSTHGAGELPSNLLPFKQCIAEEKPNLSGQKIITIALGDSSYDTYCQAGIDLTTQLTSQGAELILPIFKVDAMNDSMPEDLVIEWLTDKMPIIMKKMI